MIKQRVIWLPVLVVLVGLNLHCGSDKGSEPDGSGTAFRVELEDFTGSYDDPQSTTDISAYPCSNASQGLSVFGAYTAGEWISVPMAVAESGHYQLALRYATNAGDTIGVRVEVNECGGPFQANFSLTEGTGAG